MIVQIMIQPCIAFIQIAYHLIVFPQQFILHFRHPVPDFFVAVFQITIDDIDSKTAENNRQPPDTGQFHHKNAL